MDYTEVKIFIHGWSPHTGAVAELASAQSSEYTTESLRKAISTALDAVEELPGYGSASSWRPQISVRLWIERNLRARMRLDSGLIQRIAAAGASVDFDPYMYDELGFPRPDISGCEPKPPEVCVTFARIDSASEGRSAVATVVYDEYSFENVESGITQVLEAAASERGSGSSCAGTSELRIRSVLNRDDRASMNFSNAVVHQIALSGAALDFDPAVYGVMDSQGDE